MEPFTARDKSNQNKERRRLSLMRAESNS
uniref:Uncharacterized protein n=1 Tax=Arundo donax TaxID=35708 RepID=A0A0A9CHK5_ARUDO